MKLKKRLLNILMGVAALAPALSLMQSCSMMHDDLSDCPAGLYVRFVYDYNTARADLFKDHVGYVKLFVYDDKGRLVAEKIMANSESDQPLRQYGATMHFADGELPEGSYRLQAIAFQKHHDEALATPGAKYRTNSPTMGHELSIELDHAAEPLPGTTRHAVSNVAPLDTLWHTLKVTSLPPCDGRNMPLIAPTVKPYSIYPIEEQLVVVKAGMATYATVSLIRNTKHINILLHQIDEPDNIFHSDFEVYVTSRNKAVGHDNELTSDTELHYTPYESWTSRFDAHGTAIDPGSRAVLTDGSQRTAHFNLMSNRLMHSDNYDDASQLHIINTNTGKTVAEINLPSMLAEARTAFSMYNYSEQEYLDREYDYHLHFFLKGDTWKYCDVRVNVLSWSKRVQNVDL